MVILKTQACLHGIVVTVSGGTVMCIDPSTTECLASTHPSSIQVMSSDELDDDGYML